jgi:hypothetical protein
VLVFDQFEEAFVAGDSGRADVRSLLDELVFLAQNSVPPELARRIDQDSALATQFDFNGIPLHLMLAMRSDFLFVLNRQPLAHCARTLVNFELRSLDGVQAFRIVRQAAPNLIDEATAEAVVRIAAGAPNDTPLEATVVEPSLLSTFCREINDRRKQAGQTRIDKELLSGVGPKAILEDFYESCFADMPERIRQFVQNRLISPSGHRDTVLFETAVAELEEEGLRDAARFIDQLIQRRLLHAVQAGGIRRIELAHDILTGIALRHRETSRIQEARRAAEEAEARRMRAERTTRRMKILAFALALFCMLTLLLGLLAFHQRYLAIEAASRARLAAHSAEEQKTRAERAVQASDSATRKVAELQAELERLLASKPQSGIPEVKATASPKSNSNQ